MSFFIFVGEGGEYQDGAEEEQRRIVHPERVGEEVVQ